MSESSNWEVVLADDIDIEADEAESNPVFVAQCVDLALVRRDGKPRFHQAWEPLSFKQVFNKAKYDFRKDDYTHDWLISHANDGRLMGRNTAFGQVKAAWEALGVPISRNEVFRPLAVGGIYTVTRAYDEYPMKTGGVPVLNDDGTPKMRKTFYVKPLEKLENYVPPENPKVVRYGFDAAGIEVATATPQQVAALKSATNGKEVGELLNSLLDSGNDMIICEPFMSEAGSGALIERLTELGGKVVGGKVYFAEVVS